MKRTFWIVLTLVVASISSVSAQQSLETRNEFGLGFVLGEPSGINAQFFWSPRSAVDFTAAWSFNDWFLLSADYQVYDYIADSPREWRWYYGGGLWMSFSDDEGRNRNDDTRFGLRVPLGIRYRIPRSIVDIWGEIAPGLELAPDTEPELQGGIGVTFWLR